MRTGARWRSIVRAAHTIEQPEKTRAWENDGKRFTRLSLGFSKKLENLQAAGSVFFAFYNFVWRTRDCINGRERLPAAMLAGVVDRLWSFEDLFDAVE